MKKILFISFALLITPIFTFAANQVEINTASLQQLDEIIGIGPALAQRIIDARPFSSVDDLLRVKGIGEKTLQKIKDQGLAYVAGQIQQPAQEINPTPTPAMSPTPAPTPSPTPTPVITYPSGIFINEILPSPEGLDETNEWIELYNTNNFTVDLSDWKLQDIKGTVTTYIFPKNTNILGNGYLILKRPETKIMLNNDDDALNLILPNEKIIDLVYYSNALKNQSYNKMASDWPVSNASPARQFDGSLSGGRSDAGWQWSTTLTPEAKNIITTNSTQKQILSKSQKPNTKINKNLAAVSESINPDTNLVSNKLGQEKTKKLNPWFLFLTALVITIISAIIILILKLKIFKKPNVRT